MDFDIVTGGGPGMMDAANKGHIDGTPGKTNNSHSIGFTIRLPWETEANKHLDIKRHFNTFSNRLDHFMIVSHVAIITPGGVGTCLELFYAWQLTQVHHIEKMPIIVIGKMWEELVKWAKKYPLKAGLVSPGDFDNIHVAGNNEEAMEIIKKAYKIFQKGHKNYATNYKKFMMG